MYVMRCILFIKVYAVNFWSKYALARYLSYNSFKYISMRSAHILFSMHAPSLILFTIIPLALARTIAFVYYNSYEIRMLATCYVIINCKNISLLSLSHTRYYTLYRKTKIKLFRDFFWPRTANTQMQQVNEEETKRRMKQKRNQGQSEDIREEEAVTEQIYTDTTRQKISKPTPFFIVVIAYFAYLICQTRAAGAKITTCSVHACVRWRRAYLYKNSLAVLCFD